MPPAGAVVVVVVVDAEFLREIFPCALLVHARAHAQREQEQNYAGSSAFDHERTVAHAGSHGKKNRRVARELRLGEGT